MLRDFPLIKYSLGFVEFRDGEPVVNWRSSLAAGHVSTAHSVSSKSVCRCGWKLQGSYSTIRSIVFLPDVKDKNFGVPVKR